METRRLALLGLAVAATLAASLLLPSIVRAQQAGDTVLFIVPPGQGIAPGPEGDMAIFIGRPMGVVNVLGCVPLLDTNLRPLQTVVFVNPAAGQRATRQNGVITLYTNGVPQTTAVPNGTRIGNLVQMPQCVIGHESYDKFGGTVE